MPGTTTPEPMPLEHVTEHAQSLAVEHRDVGGRSERAAGAGQEPAHELGVVEPGEELGGAFALGALHHVDDPAPPPGGPGSASSSASARAIRIPPADGGGLVSTSRPR